jgi:hypothetical protein
MKGYRDFNVGEARATVWGTVKRASMVPKGFAFRLCERNDEADFLAGEIGHPHTVVPASPMVTLWIKR